MRATATTLAALETRRTALAAIASLEVGPQPRAVREALLGIPGALERIRNIDAQIAALRPQMTSV
jgi:hypothetical protein